MGGALEPVRFDTPANMSPTPSIKAYAAKKLSPLKSRTVKPRTMFRDITHEVMWRQCVK